MNINYFLKRSVCVLSVPMVVLWSLSASSQINISCGLLLQSTQVNSSADLEEHLRSQRLDQSFQIQDLFIDYNRGLIHIDQDGQLHEANQTHAVTQVLNLNLTTLDDDSLALSVAADIFSKSGVQLGSLVLGAEEIFLAIDPKNSERSVLNQENYFFGQKAFRYAPFNRLGLPVNNTTGYIEVFNRNAIVKLKQTFDLDRDLILNASHDYLLKEKLRYQALQAIIENNGQRLGDRYSVNSRTGEERREPPVNGPQAIGLCPQGLENANLVIRRSIPASSAHKGYEIVICI